MARHTAGAPDGVRPGSLSDPAVPAAARRSIEADGDTPSTSLSSLCGGGKSAVPSAPSSAAGASDPDGWCVLHVSDAAVAIDDDGVARPDGPGRATTATHGLSVTTQSTDGASSRDACIPNTTATAAAAAAAGTLSAAPAPLPASTAPGQHPRQGRTVRGRTPGTSRHVSASHSNSAAHSTDRSTVNSTNSNKIGTIGICALDSKARSKPSRNILNRLVGKDNQFDVIIFGDKVILDENVENWPICDFLISFFSDGFPLEKAIAYAKLRRPFCVNDLPMQTVLWDRRMCLMILDRLGVPTPERLEVNRDGGPVALTADIAARMKQLTQVELIGSDDGRGGGSPPPRDVHMEDDNDTLTVDGRKLRKPFVEKPTSGEDHNINIYYPKSQGGGGRRLFRKINNKSSEKDDSLIVPKAVTEPDGSYIYEQFLKVENAEDVKAYTVGEDFCHAETRKSPVVDGVVKRNPNGKEIRYVTTLTSKEREMAAKIARGFGQRVCGFDLLRVDDKSFVIDVNGWSFVKDNNDYYDNAARILKAMFIAEKRKWDGRAASSESDDAEAGRMLLPPTSVPDSSQAKRPAIGKDGELGSGGHRAALGGGLLRSRSISQLRDTVHHAAHKVSRPYSIKSPIGTTSPIKSPTGTTGPIKSPTGTTGPITSPPPAERDLDHAASFHRRARSVHNDRTEHVPPPPAVSSQIDHLRTEENGPSVSSDLESVAHSEAPSQLPAPAAKSQWRLKGMVAVIRHADRTPKQKFKFTFHTKPFVDLLKGHQEEVLLVGEAALHSVQQAVRQAMSEGIEDTNKLRALQNALAKKGAWPGTKVQIKPMFKKPKSTDQDQPQGDGNEQGKTANKEREQAVPTLESTEPGNLNAWRQECGGDSPRSPAPPRDFGEASDSAGPSRVRAAERSDSMPEITMSRHAAADQNLVLDKLQLVMKWGGEPTHSARYQATDLGENMRNDLLLMNRRVLDDVSIYTSSERRVTTSAQIFAAAFLDQSELSERQITVRKDLLDDSNAAKDEMDRVKKKLKGLLRKGHQAPEQFAWPKDGTPEPYLVVRRVVELMKFHRRVMRHNFAKLQASEAVSRLEKIQKSPGVANRGNEASGLANGFSAAKSPSPSKKDAEMSSNEAQANIIQSRWCTGEDAELFKERWEKLFNEFTDAEKVDPSKVSELYDTMKFDALHNRPFLEWVFTPSKSILSEDDESDASSRLKRTESQIMREEFADTHERRAPAGDAPAPALDSDAAPGDLAEMNPLHLPPPHRSDTASTTFSSMENSTGSLSRSKRESKDGDSGKTTFSQRLGFRRKSADLMAVAKNVAMPATGVPAVAASDDPSSSYFNLYKGSASAQSKVKNDRRLEKLNELYSLSKILFDFIGPQEYGITDTEKLEIGLLTSLPLLKEIVKDLVDLQKCDDPKSYIYFTKESHIYTLLNCILEGGIPTKIARNAIPELDYLSQICFELYESEDPEACNLNDPNAPFSYSIRITISPGCHTFDPLDVQLDSKHCIGCAPRRSLTSHGDWKEVIHSLREKFQMVKLPKSFTAINVSEQHPEAFTTNELPHEGAGDGHGDGEREMERERDGERERERETERERHREREVSV